MGHACHNRDGHPARPPARDHASIKSWQAPQDGGRARRSVRRVIATDGTAVGARRAVARAAAFPLSFLLLGLGFAGILLGERRRALHDVIAGTAVIYSWDARAARLRFLSRT